MDKADKDFEYFMQIAMKYYGGEAVMLTPQSIFRIGILKDAVKKLREVGFKKEEAEKICIDEILGKVNKEYND